MIYGGSRLVGKSRSEPLAVKPRDARVEEGSPSVDKAAISEFIKFFKLLDKWDREVTNGKVV
jgi:hypothetical protein